MRCCVKTEILYSYLNNEFPFNFQEKYDNSGGQIYFPQNEIKNILLSLDINISIVNEAIEKSCNLIITHHPLLFKPISSITQGNPLSDIVLKLIDNKISLISLHTNLDKIYYDKLSSFLGFSQGELLSRDLDLKWEKDEKGIGFGMICTLNAGMKLVSLIDHIKSFMDLEHIIYAGDLDSKINRIAFINGSGTSFIKKIISDNTADCIVTGDVGYHSANDAQMASISIIDAGHFNTEVVLLNFLCNNIQDFLTNSNLSQDIHLYISSVQENPLKIY